VPGDVDYAAVELEDAFLYTLDDLEKVTREGVKTREVETNKAWKIVEDEVTNVFTEQEKLVSDNKELMSNDFIEGLRQKALAEALGDADKATQLFFQSLKHYEKATKALPGVESNDLDK
jgi:glutamyl-tRNA reductase